MNHLRHIKYACATALVASLATFGCSKDDSSSSSKGGPAPAGAKAAFSVFPKNTSMVLGIDIAHITSGDLYKKFKPMIEGQIAEAGDELAQLKEKCGIDPFTDFKSAIVGAEVDEDMEPDEKTMIVVIKGPARSKLVECGKKMAEDDGPTLTEEGKFTKVEDDGETKWIGWMDDNTMAIAPEMDKAALEARLGGKDGLDGNKEMMDLLGNTDMSSGLWFAMAPKDGIKAPSGGMGMPSGDFKAAFGSVSVKSGLSLDFGMRTGSKDEASKLASELEKQVGQMKPMLGPAAKFVDKLKIKSSGADLVLAISLSVSDIEELMALAGPMMGGF